MGFDGISELAAAARARNEERKAAKNAALTAPLQERIAELEALLAEAVKRGDALEALLQAASKGSAPAASSAGKRKKAAP